MGYKVVANWRGGNMGARGARGRERRERAREGARGREMVEKNGAKKC
jgi:hypothetical protein